MLSSYLLIIVQTYILFVCCEYDMPPLMPFSFPITSDEGAGETPPKKRMRVNEATEGNDDEDLAYLQNQVAKFRLISASRVQLQDHLRQLVSNGMGTTSTESATAFADRYAELHRSLVNLQKEEYLMGKSIVRAAHVRVGQFKNKRIRAIEVPESEERLNLLQEKIDSAENLYRMFRADASYLEALRIVIEMKTGEYVIFTSRS